MFTLISDWLEHRVGLRKLVGATLLEGVPGGARWRYVWGSCLAFVFSIQLITGIMLMTAYSPSSTQAWSSVHFIQYKMDFGWLIRGLHHFGSQTMMVLIGLHMLQVVIAGAHLPPREINWWTGLGLLGVTFGLSLTGYLLPWDQKGYWATRVATNIANNIPVVGADIRQLLVGGEDYGNHTLTRFYALHVSVLPGALILLLIIHIYVFRRQGVTSAANVEGLVTNPSNEHGAETFWPRQAFYDMLACMVVFGIMLGLLFFPYRIEPDGHWFFGNGHPVKVEGAATDPAEYGYWAKAGQRGVGADLDAAADRDTANYPARPEWYFLFLFQLLKYFDGEKVLIGTVFIPNGAMLLLTLLPFFGYGPMRKIGHLFGVLVMVTLIVLAGGLTVLAFRDDSPDGIFWGKIKNDDEKAIKKASEFQHAQHESEALAARACQLAMDGTPVEGGHFLLRNDPKTAGKKAFEKNCGSCHNFTAKDDPSLSWTGGKSASDLGDFGTEDWVYGLLKNSLDHKYFGLVKEPGQNTYALTGMSAESEGWRERINNMRAENPGVWNKEKIAQQENIDFKLIAKWVASQSLPRDQRKEAKLAKLTEDGAAAFFNKQNMCSSCHTAEKLEEGKFVRKGGKSAPDLTSYGSAEWIRGMIMSPKHKSRYKTVNLMPAFRDLDGPAGSLALQECQDANPETAVVNLSNIDRELIIRWILRDYRPVFGGTPIK